MSFRGSLLQLAGERSQDSQCSANQKRTYPIFQRLPENDVCEFESSHPSHAEDNEPQGGDYLQGRFSDARGHRAITTCHSSANQLAAHWQMRSADLPCHGTNSSLNSC